MFNIFKDTIAKDLTKIADYFNAVADAGVTFKDKRALAVNRIKNAVLDGDIGGGGGVTPEIEAEIENAQWKTETSTPLFSETVTTVDEGNTNEATLSYAEPITADTLKITFNGVEYTCTKRTLEGSDDVYYGAPYNVETEGFDFSEYHFNILSSPLDSNIITTETPGTHTVSASEATTTYTDTFKNGVNANVFKEVSDISEADVVIVYIPNRITTNIPLISVQGDSTNATVSISPNAYQHLLEGYYFFWKVHPLTFTGGVLTLYCEGGTAIEIHLPTNHVENNGVHTFDIFGDVFVTLGSENSVMKFYSIGMPSNVSDGEIS